MPTPETFLTDCQVHPAVFELRPDYRAQLLVIDCLDPAALAAGTETIDALVSASEVHAGALLAATPVEELPHIAAWREAYRAFGAKPQRTRNSLEALTRRAGSGLPRVNPLTDLYNAISVLHQMPLGGEDLAGYEGPARLIRATGAEPFDTTVGGELAIEHPRPGEVVWCDARGVTCRRWNWRQGTRTGLTANTRTALFILDVLSPVSDVALGEATGALVEALTDLSPDVRETSRLIAAP